MAYVIVDTWSSRCSARNGNADPNEDWHLSGGPYLSGGNGCAARWDRAVDPNGLVLHVKPPRPALSGRCPWHSGCDESSVPGDPSGYCAGHIALVSGRAVRA